MESRELLDKIKIELEINNEQLAWLKSTAKKMNGVTLFCFGVSLTLMMCLNLFFTDIFPPMVAINNLLPVGVFGSICTMVTGGTLVFSNILFWGCEFFLKKKKERLRVKLREVIKTLSKINSNKQNNVNSKEVKRELNYSYKKNNQSNRCLNSSLNEKNIKKKVRVKNKIFGNK